MNKDLVIEPSGDIWRKEDGVWRKVYINDDTNTEIEICDKNNGVRR